MAIFTKDTKLCDVILAEPSVIQVINRFGVFLGVGDSTIKTISIDHDINIDLFLSVLNTYMNRNYFPDKRVDSDFLPGLIDYLEKTDLYYKEILLPNIERHFSFLISKSEQNVENSNLHLLQGFFWEVREEMLHVIERDITIWFPLIDKCIQDKNTEKMNVEDVPFPFDNHLLEEKIGDLINFFVIHLKGDYNHNLCVAVVSALATLEKDVKQNNRIRDRILKPLCQKLLS
ncbi:MAG: helix-turn-helix transcriptional regulator [Muribaculaceae bacterium]|nr:helix-turn-helix transcriptional regulator [Muribaculaceae bacterium]